MRDVLILRPDNLGDVILFSGALRHIRARFPAARITLCVREYARDVVALSPFVDRVISWESLHAPLLDALPRFRGRGRLDAALRSALHRLRIRPDLLLLPVRSPTPAMHRLARAAGARARYAVTGDGANGADDGQGYDRVLTLPPERARDHDFAVTRDFLALLGIHASLDELRPELWTDRADRAWAEAAVPRDGAVVLGIAPGVTAPVGKFYPLEGLARAVRLTDAPLRVVLFGSAAEAGMCAELAALLADNPRISTITNLAGRSTIREMIEGIRRCDLLLAPDAAALHVAVALGKPTVGIVGGGHPGRFHPWGDPAINHLCGVPMDCFGCNWTCRHSSVRCVQDVTPEQIARSLRAAIGATVGAAA